MYVSDHFTISFIITKITHSNPKISERGIEVLNYIVCNCDEFVKTSFLTVSTLNTIRHQIDGGHQGTREKILECIPLWIAIYSEAYLTQEQKGILDTYASILNQNDGFSQTVNITNIISDGYHISPDNNQPGCSFQRVQVQQQVNINNQSVGFPSKAQNTNMYTGAKTFNPGENIGQIQIYNSLLQSLQGAHFFVDQQQSPEVQHHKSGKVFDFGPSALSTLSHHPVIKKPIPNVHVAQIPKFKATVSQPVANEPSVSPSPLPSAEDKCIICLDERKVYACIPCGHKIVCDTCFQGSEGQSQFPNCPICRKTNQQLLKIYD